MNTIETIDILALADVTGGNQAPQQPQQPTEAPNQEGAGVRVRIPRVGDVDVGVRRSRTDYATCVAATAPTGRSIREECGLPPPR